MTRVVVVDDHRLLAQMLADHLRERSLECLVVEVDEAHLTRRIRELTPDLLLLDAVFGEDENGGMDVLTELMGGDFPRRIVILTGVTDQLQHARFLAAGATAVISKSAGFDDVIEQVDDVIEGRDPMGVLARSTLARRLQHHEEALARQGAPLAELTEREQTTLQALVDGLSAEEIAQDRTVAVSTVRSQIRAVLRKLEVHSQVEAVSVAVRLGMRPEPEPA